MPRPLRVLHLEDNPRDAAMVRDRLEVDGVSCDIHRADGRESFESALAGESFDLIISDYNLPGYDGIAALKQAQAVQPDVPVILVSVSEEEAVRCLQFGATDYLLKARLDRLAPAVQRAIHEAETRIIRKRAEVALAQSERRKAAILDSVLDCIITMDADGMVIEYNAAAERTFGYTRAEAVGRTLADLIVPPAFREAHKAGLARYLATGAGPLLGRVIEVTAVRADGSELPVELAITAIQSESTPIFTGVLRDITARTRADEARARLAAIVDSSDDAIFSMGLDDVILTWNAGAERLYGYAASEVIGRNRALLVPPGAAVELSGILDKAARGEPGEPCETQRIRKDGSLIDISLMISPMTDPTGRIIGVSTVARDITSRKRAEAELKVLNDEIQVRRLREVEDERRRADALEEQIVERKRAERAVRGERDRAQRYLDAPEVILIALDLEGRVVLANRYACSILGWTADELRGRDWVETCVPARMREALKKRFRGLVAGDLSVVESLVVARSGEERLIEWRNTVQCDDTGRVIGTFSSGADITERNQAVAALRTAEERMRFALQSARVGIWDIDYVTGALQWSETLESQYGVQPGTFAGTFEAFIDRIHPDDRESVLATLAEAMRSGAVFSVHHRSLWPDGTVRWLSGSGRVHLGEHGEPVRGVGISQDVTERKSAEAELERLNLEIQLQRLRVFKATLRTVQDIVNNLLNGFQLVRVEAEDQLPVEVLALIDQMIQEASVKLKTLGNLETIQEKEMALGMGIDYPGAAF